MGRDLLQSERNATLWIDVLRSCVHLLIRVGGDMTIERQQGLKARSLIQGFDGARLKAMP
jgi:hypothetical protein